MARKCRNCGSKNHHLLKDCKSLVPVEGVFSQMVENDIKVLNDKGCWSISNTNANMTIHHPHHGTVYLTRLSYAVRRGMRYEQVQQDIPVDGESCQMVVTNWCGTSRCLNPLHLIHMTRQRLISRSVKSGNRKTGISDEDKREIRRKYKSGSFSQKQLAAEYGIKQPSVSYICKHWKDPIESNH